MNKIAVVVAVFFVLTTQSCSAQKMFTVEVEPSGIHVYKGIMSRADIAEDSTLVWYRTNYDSYRPDSATMKELKPLLADVSFVLVLGTWCGDSKREVPHLYKIFDATAVDDDDVWTFGVDRTKKSPDGTTEKYAITRVPTLIVFKEGKELGRITEHPRETLEYDLLKIVKP